MPFVEIYSKIKIVCSSENLSFQTFGGSKFFFTLQFVFLYYFGGVYSLISFVIHSLYISVDG